MRRTLLVVGGAAAAVIAAAGVVVASEEIGHVEPSVATVHLDLGRGAQLAPVVGSDGQSMVGPDGRDRCVAIAPPPPALALQPNAHADDPAAYDTLQQAARSGGELVALADRPITLADTVPCP
jgi:hypothetical protein